MFNNIVLNVSINYEYNLGGCCFSSYFETFLSLLSLFLDCQCTMLINSINTNEANYFSCTSVESWVIMSNIKISWKGYMDKQCNLILKDNQHKLNKLICPSLLPQRLLAVYGMFILKTYYINIELYLYFYKIIIILYSRSTYL